jgi:hypothetical protein
MRRFLAVCLLLSPGFAPAPLTPPLRAQPPTASRQAAIDEVYAAMFAALEAGVFARARNLCDQVILWEPGNPVHHYNLACIEARAGAARIDPAFAALTRAVDLGFVDATHARGDPDLAGLHRDPRFAALLARMDAARAALPAAPASSAPAILTVDTALPRGLFLATPAGLPPGVLAPERSLWFFADDGAVALDPIHGFAADGRIPAEARRATATLQGDVLTVAWADGARLDAKLTAAAGGFTWQGWQFVPVSAAPAPAQLAGRYTRGAAFSLRANLPDTPAELTLAGDGRAEWTTADHRAVSGRWQLAAHTLELAPAGDAAPGPTGRYLCFLFRSAAATDATPLLYVGGFIFERQP